MYKRILCPVDGSATSNRGMEEAIKLAKDQQAQLKFIHVVDTYFPIIDGVGNLVPVDVTDALHDNAKLIIKQVKASAINEGVDAEAEVLETIDGRIANNIVQHAKDWKADIIVMGTHGLRGLNRMVMGSDAENVLRVSTVPILLINMSGSADR